MKKIIALIIVVVLLLAFTGCGGTIPSYTENWGKLNVDELSKYKITLDKSLSEENGVADERVPELFGEGTYETHLTSTDGKVFTLETKLNFVGYYVLQDGEKIDVNDTITSKCSFENIELTFAPIKSEKTYNGKTINFIDEKFEVNPLVHTEVIDYSGSKIQFESTINYGDLNKDGMQVIKKTLNKPGGTLYDNSELFYVFRGYQKTLNDSINFNLIEGVNGKTKPMVMKVGSSIVSLDTNINGTNAKMDTYPVAVDGQSITDGGAAIKLYYAKDDNGAVNRGTIKDGKVATINIDRSRLVRILQNVPYSSNVFVYDLIEYSYGK